MRVSAPVFWRLMEWIVIAAILFILALTISSATAKGQTCLDSATQPVKVRLVGKNPITGESVYYRDAWVFFGPAVSETGRPAEAHLVVEQLVILQQWTREDRCDESEQELVETGNFYVNNCPAVRGTK